MEQFTADIRSAKIALNGANEYRRHFPVMMREQLLEIERFIHDIDKKVRAIKEGAITTEEEMTWLNEMVTVINTLRDQMITETTNLKNELKGKGKKI